MGPPGSSDRTAEARPNHAGRAPLPPPPLDPVWGAGPGPRRVPLGLGTSVRGVGRRGLNPVAAQETIPGASPAGQRQVVRGGLGPLATKHPRIGRSPPVQGTPEGTRTGASRGSRGGRAARNRAAAPVPTPRPTSRKPPGDQWRTWPEPSGELQSDCDIPGVKAQAHHLIPGAAIEEAR